MIKDGQFTWKAYLFFVVVAIAGGLAIHWGLLNFIAPGQENETKYIGMVANTVVQNVAASPGGNPLANLPMPAHG